MKVCLDTNALSALMVEGMGERTVLARKAMEEAERVFVPTIVLGEIYLGFVLGLREAENRQHLGKILEQPGVMVASVDADTAERFALIAGHLRKLGKPIATNDIWIASVALNLGASLLTFDRDFRNVPGLLVVPKA